MNNAIYRKLFLSPYYFTIAVGRKTHSVIEDTTFQAEYVLPADPKKWAADPMLVEWQGETFLFYEAVHHDKGRIEVARVREDCTLSEPTVLLEDECHYSYPFVFRHQDRWYMIPESSAKSEVRLYEATEFPDHWKLRTVLLHEKAVDTTIMELDGTLLLLTDLIHPGSERVTPKAYRMQLDADRAELTPMRWEQYDELASRGAGPAIRDRGALYRPAQMSEEQVYGNAVAFYRVRPEGDAYQEEQCCVLKPENVRAPHCWYDGLHTYTESDRFAVIDLRCRKFDWLKVPKALCAKLKR